jgi:threonine synthase
LLFSKKEGILISPEGAATFMALDQLNLKGEIKKDAKILLLNTGSGYKYIENII